MEVKLDGFKRLNISFNSLRKNLYELFLSREATLLKEVTISGFDKVLKSDEDCDYYFDKFLSHFSHIESLTIKGSDLTTDHHLKIIAGRLKKLQHLTIAINSSITDVGLCYLSGAINLSEDVSCPLLQSLEIERACGITSKGIQTITTRLHKLEHLDLWVNQVDDNVVQCITGNKSLKRVSLSCEDKEFIAEIELMKKAGFEMVYRGPIAGDSENGYMQHWTWDSQQS